ncbi:unnamed protein product [Polarella glacialis]|uniref:Lipid-binding serum glycoprotein N-terminal domain-containing protein n=1 Tax=Polarella glacialis TaxID=89957 RepID=A0A813FSI8_POLGL|nr:unnamed protein product [Polarella glacialis]
MARLAIALSLVLAGVLQTSAEENPLLVLINSIATNHVLKDINEKLPGKVLELGLDPLTTATEDGEDLKVSNIVGLKNVVVDSVQVTSVALGDAETLANFDCKAHFTENLTATLQMGVGNSFNAEAIGLRAVLASFQATLDLHKLEVTSLRVVKLDLQFDDLSLSLSDGMSGFNPIFTLAGDQKVKMEAMVSKKVQSFAQEALSLMMPIKLPEQAVETAMFYP